MATLRNQRKLAAISKVTKNEPPRNGHSGNTSSPRINEEWITHVFGEIEGKVTKKSSQEFKRTKTQFFGVLSKLDGFLLNLIIQTLFRTVSGTSQNMDVGNQEATGDKKQNYQHPEMEFFVCPSCN